MAGRLAIAVAAVVLATAAPARADWLPPTDLAPANPQNVDVRSPSLAVAPDGTAFIAFMDANARAAVSIAPPGAAFSAPQELSPAGQLADDPVVAVDRHGNATAAWFDVTDLAMETRTRPAGGDWGPAATLQPAGGAVRGPILAVARNGAAAVAWHNRATGQAAQVRVAVRPAGGVFGPGLAASPDLGTGLCPGTRVAVDDAGDAVALWTRRTTAGGGWHVESAVKPAAAPAFAAFEPRSPTTADSPCNLGLDMTADGRVTAMWDFGAIGQAPPYVGYADRGTPFATGAWSNEAKLSVPADASNHPTLTLDDAGTTLVTWLDGAVLQSAVRPGLGAFTGQRALSGATDTRGQAVAASSDGDALAAFVGTVNGNDAIFAARMSSHPPGAFGDPVPVATTPPGGARIDFDSPAVALDDQGNGFAAWRAVPFPIGPSVVRVARFDPVPPAITAANVPATALTGQSVAMSAAATDRMSGAALHFTFGDGSGADGGSVAHVYAAPGTYTVTVAATDGAGNRSATARTLAVSNPPPPPPPPPGKLLTVASLSWDRLPNGATRLRKLVVEGLAGPETVRLSCRGKGCRRHVSGIFRKHGTKLVLTKRVKGMVLRPRARLTIATTRPGYIARTITYTMVRHKDPKKATVCRPPGTKHARAC